MPVRAPVDTAALKRANPIADVAARYTELRRRGRALVGLCPLHADGRNPNFYVYAYVIWNPKREGMKRPPS